EEEDTERGQNEGRRPEEIGSWKRDQDGTEPEGDARDHGGSPDGAQRPVPYGRVVRGKGEDQRDHLGHLEDGDQKRGDQRRDIDLDHARTNEASEYIKGA